MKNLRYSIIIFSFYWNISQAQHTEEHRQKLDIGLEGMIGVSVGNNFYAFNVGGPSLMLRLHKNFKIGVGAFPTFYILNGKTGARLGVSPKIDYKDIALIAPFYHRDSTNE